MNRLVYPVVLLLLLYGCENLSKKNKIVGSWQVNSVDMTGAKVAIHLLKQLLPELSVIDNLSFLGDEFLVDQLKENILNARFEFHDNNQLTLIVAGQKIQGTTWRRDQNQEHLLVIIEQTEIPFKITEITSEKMHIHYEIASNQPLQLILSRLDQKQ